MLMKMCMGREEDLDHKSFSCNNPSKQDNGPISCELCNSSASLYCQADNAFLCRKCDRWVHGANFLAQRHIRCLLCSTCRCLTQRYLIGISAEVTLPTVLQFTESSNSNNNNNNDSSSISHCNLNLGREHSRTVKEPFLFL